MTVPMKFVAAIFALVSVTALAFSPTQAQTESAAQNPRIALVIGNSAYPDHPLATAANDAGLVAQTLQAAGFEVVGARDLDQNSLRGALRDFLDKAAAIGPDMQAFVYLSGRGVQYEGDNYFVPVDARIARDADVPIQAIKISDFSHALAATPGRARILVLDAARANSFAATGAPLAGGLALVDAEAGTLTAFNAAPGTVAPDEPGPYGAYGKSLAGAMREGGLPIEDVFAQTRLQVNQQTNGAVIPWSVSKVQEPYSIFERAPDAPPPPAIAAAAEIAKRPMSSFGPNEAYSVAVQHDTMKFYQEFLAAYPDSPQARRVRAILAARREAIFWRRSVAENSPRAYWTYLRVYPNGPHVADAQRRLEILSAEFQPPPDFAPVEYSDLPPPPPDELIFDTGPVFVFDGPDYGPPPPPPPYGFIPEEDDRWRDLPPPPPPQGLGYPYCPSRFRCWSAPGSSTRRERIGSRPRPARRRRCPTGSNRITRFRPPPGPRLRPSRQTHSSRCRLVRAARRRANLRSPASSRRLSLLPAASQRPSPRPAASSRRLSLLPAASQRPSPQPAASSLCRSLRLSWPSRRLPRQSSRPSSPRRSSPHRRNSSRRRLPMSPRRSSTLRRRSSISRRPPPPRRRPSRRLRRPRIPRQASRLAARLMSRLARSDWRVELK
jgi:uncharacterized caspase-like protein